MHIEKFMNVGQLFIIKTNILQCIIFFLKYFYIYIINMYECYQIQWENHVHFTYILEVAHTLFPFANT